MGIFNSAEDDLKEAMDEAYSKGQKDYASSNTGIGGGRPSYGATELLFDGESEFATKVTQANRDGWKHAESQD